jgi:hypothetical protein
MRLPIGVSGRVQTEGVREHHVPLEAVASTVNLAYDPP